MPRAASSHACSVRSEKVPSCVVAEQADLTLGARGRDDDIQVAVGVELVDDGAWDGEEVRWKSDTIRPLPLPLNRQVALQLRLLSVSASPCQECVKDLPSLLLSLV